MIQLVLRLFQDLLRQKKIKSINQLNPDKVCQLYGLVEILTPLADLTDQMQKELEALGIILPAVTKIKSLLTTAALPMDIASFAVNFSQQCVHMLHTVKDRQTHCSGISVRSKFQDRVGN